MGSLKKLFITFASITLFTSTGHCGILDRIGDFFSGNKTEVIDTEEEMVNYGNRAPHSVNMNNLDEVLSRPSTNTLGLDAVPAQKGSPISGGGKFILSQSNQRTVRTYGNGGDGGNNSGNATKAVKIDRKPSKEEKRLQDKIDTIKKQIAAVERRNPDKAGERNQRSMIELRDMQNKLAKVQLKEDKKAIDKYKKQQARKKQASSKSSDDVKKSSAKNQVAENDAIKQQAQKLVKAQQASKQQQANQGRRVAQAKASLRGDQAKLRQAQAKKERINKSSWSKSAAGKKALADNEAYMKRLKAQIAESSEELEDLGVSKSEIAALTKAPAKQATAVKKTVAKASAQKASSAQRGIASVQKQPATKKKAVKSAL